MSNGNSFGADGGNATGGERGMPWWLAVIRWKRRGT